MTNPRPSTQAPPRGASQSAPSSQSTPPKSTKPMGMFATIALLVGAGALGAYMLDLHGHTCDKCGQRWRHFGAFNLGDEDSHTCARCGQVQWWKCGAPHVLRGSQFVTAPLPSPSDLEATTRALADRTPSVGGAYMPAEEHAPYPGQVSYSQEGDHSPYGHAPYAEQQPYGQPAPVYGQSAPVYGSADPYARPPLPERRVPSLGSSPYAQIPDRSPYMQVAARHPYAQPVERRMPRAVGSPYERMLPSGHPGESMEGSSYPSPYARGGPLESERLLPGGGSSSYVPGGGSSPYAQMPPSRARTPSRPGLLGREVRR